MDFSRTKVYQRTRSCYEKLYKEYSKKKSTGSESEGDLVKVEEDSGSEKHLERGKKRVKNVRTSDSLQNSTDDAVSCLRDNDEGKRGFAHEDPTVSSHGCPLDESEDDEGVTYLGDDYDPSHSSRVESNEVKVSAVELDSVRAERLKSPRENDDGSQGSKSPKDDADDLQKLELESESPEDDSQKLISPEEDSPMLKSPDEDEGNWHEEDVQPSENGVNEFIIISSSDSEDSEEDVNTMVDVNDDDSSVLEVENISDTGDRFLMELFEKRTLDEGDEEDSSEGEYFLEGKPSEDPKKDEKVDVSVARVGRKRCGSSSERHEGGWKKMRTNTGASLGSGPANADGEDTFWQIVDEKGTETAGKHPGRSSNGLGNNNKVDVIKILTDTMRAEGDGDDLLRRYVTPTEEEAGIYKVRSHMFRFEDDDDVEPEKPEFEMELHGLFDEMNMCLQLSEIGSSGALMASSGGADFLMEGRNRAPCCHQGKHQLTINDQFGIICRCCSYVEMEIRDILPPLSKNDGRGGHGRYEMDKADGLKISRVKWGDCSHGFFHDSKRREYEEGTVWDLVPGIKESMYPHQREGFEFIWEKIAGGIYIEKLEKRLSNDGSGCIISHAPGTGKSRLTIVFLQAFMRMYPDSRPLIIAPRSMLLTWEEEFKKWKVDVPFHNLNNNDCSGEEDSLATSLLKQAGNAKGVRCVRTLKLYSWKKKLSVLGITYRLFESLAGEEGKRKRTVKSPKEEEIKRMLLKVPTLIVLDEGHTPRNDQSLVWKALLNVKTKRSIILSGTPFQNNFDELYNTLCLVNPTLSLRISGISKRGWKSSAARGQWDTITSSVRKSQQKLDQLKAMIDPFVHVHKGMILQERLPGLKDALVVLKPTKIQRTLLERMAGSKLSLEHDYYMSLVSVHPSILCMDFAAAKGFHKMLQMYEKDPCAGVKTNFLMELMKLSGALNEKVLVFSQYIKPLEFILKLFKAKFNWNEGKECLYMDGQQEEKQRQASINTLNDPKSEVKVLLASLKACSEGINLVGASRVVLLDVHWNPSVERQAISRAYRLGQKKMVHVYHLVTGTMESEKYIRQVEKSHLSELVFSSKNSDNGNRNPEISSTVSADKILEGMVQHEKLQDMFLKVIYQPKETDLIKTFC